MNSTLLDTVKEELLELEELSIIEKQELEELSTTEKQELQKLSSTEAEPVETGDDTKLEEAEQENKQSTKPEEIISTDDPSKINCA